MPRLFPASRPFGPDTSGLLRQEMLMWSPVPANQGSAPVAHLSPKRRKAGGAFRRIETWDFPSLGERWLGLPPHPRPKCQVSSRGGVGCEVSFARSTSCKVDSPHRRPRPRAHTLMHTHTHALSHTNTRTQIHSLRCASETTAQIVARRALFPSFPTGGARGGAPAAEKLITDSADYSGSLC